MQVNKRMGFRGKQGTGPATVSTRRAKSREVFLQNQYAGIGGVLGNAQRGPQACEPSADNNNVALFRQVTWL